MKIELKTLLSTPWLALLLVSVLSACSGSHDDDEPAINPGSLTVTSYNMGLALNFVPYTDERLVANEALLPDYESDVLCMQEVWLDDQVDAVKQALGESYPHIYSVPPQQVFSETAACTNEEVAGFENCARTLCPDLSGGELVSCAVAQCVPTFLPQLSPGCSDAVIGAVGIPNVTVDALVDAVTKPAGLFAYNGSLGLILASRYELQAREFQDFIDDSSGNHRGALYAEVELGGQGHVVGCTHPTANLSIPYPASGKHGSWEGENLFMIEQMVSYANSKAGDKPILFAGDFNCSIANASNGVDADFAASCELLLDDGFVDPAADQLACTYCSDENLILLEQASSGNYLLDHVFVKNLATASDADALRVFDNTVSIEALIPPVELKPEDSPKLTHPSDHFGVEIEVALP